MDIFIREEVCEKKEVEAPNGDWNTHLYEIWDSEVHETNYHSVAQVFKATQREYGKCVSKVYIDQPNQPAKHIGWCFEKKVKYTDSKEFYTQETWITLYSALPTRTITYHYLE